jgi:magnesium chelatase subunit D
LEEGTASHIASALDAGEVRVEREGLSARSRAEFVLVGTFNPGEGEVSPRLRNRAGLIVETAQEVPPDSRVEIITRASRFHESPGLFRALFEEEDEEIARAVARARERLPRVEISREDIRKLSLAAMALGVEGNGWDLVAVRAARASAALAGRDEVCETDMLAAIRMALAPRAERLPEPGGLDETDDVETGGRSNEAAGDDISEAVDPGDGLSRQAEEMVIRAIDSQALDLSPSILKSGGPSAASGRRALAHDGRRGRHVRNSEPKQPSLNISVAATLRAAAPFQKRRRERAGNLGEIAKRAAVKIEPSDLRFKQFKRRSGMLFVFAIDGSGSMALNRMAQAKGAMVRLLQAAYLHRDKVALVCFRGNKAEVLMGGRPSRRA